MDLQFGHYRLLRNKRIVAGPEGELELSSRSFDILLALLAEPDGVVGKAQLMDAAWPGTIVEENALHVHISALRKTLPPDMIKTVHGRGYKYSGPKPLPIESVVRVGADAKQAGAGSNNRPMVAVLPFTNMSTDATEHYLGDGLADDIIVGLSRYRPLRVIAWQSSAILKGTSVDIAEVGRRLGAHYLVTGSVRKSAESIRVIAQLVDSQSATHVWAERYDHQSSSTLLVQDSLVRRVVSSIVGQVELDLQSRAVTKASGSLDAYDCWLRANHGLDLWTLDGNAASRRLLEEALAIDPSFARAHASLAFCNIRMVHLAPGTDGLETLELEALHYAEHAVRLDPSEARSFNAVGWSNMYLREFERARSAFLLSASLNPNDASSCLDRALAFAFLGEQERADEHLETASSLYPLRGEWFHSVRSIVNFLGRRHEAAEESFVLGPRTLPDDLAFHAANLWYLGHRERSSKVLGEARKHFDRLWKGSMPATAGDFSGWLSHVCMLQREADWDRLHGVLQLSP